MHTENVKHLINVTYQMELRATWRGKDCPCLEQVSEA